MLREGGSGNLRGRFDVIPGVVRVSPMETFTKVERQTRTTSPSPIPRELIFLLLLLLPLAAWLCWWLHHSLSPSPGRWSVNDKLLEIFIGGVVWPNKLRWKELAAKRVQCSLRWSTMVIPGEEGEEEGAWSVNHGGITAEVVIE